MSASFVVALDAFIGTARGRALFRRADLCDLQYQKLLVWYVFLFYAVFNQAILAKFHAFVIPCCKILVVLT